MAPIWMQALSGLVGIGLGALFVWYASEKWGWF